MYGKYLNGWDLSQAPPSSTTSQRPQAAFAIATAPGTSTNAKDDLGLLQTYMSGKARSSSPTGANHHLGSCTLATAAPHSPFTPEPRIRKRTRSLDGMETLGVCEKDRSTSLHTCRKGHAGLAYGQQVPPRRSTAPLKSVDRLVFAKVFKPSAIWARTRTPWCSSSPTTA